MKREFKSSPREMRGTFLAFAVMFIFVLLLIGYAAGAFKNSESVLMKAYIIVSIVLGIAGAAVFTVKRLNITVAVNDEEVTFSRNGKVYLTLPFRQYEFASSVTVYRHNGVQSNVNRHIKATPRNGGSTLSLECFCFSRVTFEECMAYITSRRVKKILGEADREKLRKILFGQGNEPLTFFINKMFWVSHRKKWLFILTAVFAVIALSPLLIALNGDVIFGVILTLLLLPVAAAFDVGTAVKPFQKARKAPRKITLNAESVVVDERTFFFKDVLSVKMTPPSYTDTDSGFYRLLRITDGGGENVYYLADRYDLTAKADKPKIFADYERFFNTFRSILALQADENGESKFVSELA